MIHIYFIEEDTETFITVVFMATFGGFINWLRQKGPKNFGRLFIITATAAFAGLLAFYITSAMSGIAGYGGGSLLDDAVKKIKSFINGKNNS